MYLRQLKRPNSETAAINVASVETNTSKHNFKAKAHDAQIDQENVVFGKTCARIKEKKPHGLFKRKEQKKKARVNAFLGTQLLLRGAQTTRCARRCAQKRLT